MKKLIVKTALGMVLLAGCGGTGLRGTGGDPAADATDTTGTSAQAIQVDVRMKAVDTAAFTSLSLVADRIDVVADGIPLPGEATFQVAELTDEQQSWKIGQVSVPADTKVVEFAIHLSPAGSFQNAQGEGWIDSRQSVIRFTSTIENLTSKGKAVVELKAGKSFIAKDADQLAFVPQYRIRY